MQTVIRIVNLAKDQCDGKQSRLAKRLTVDEGTVSAWAMGHTEPKGRHLVELCRIALVSMDEEFGLASVARPAPVNEMDALVAKEVARLLVEKGQYALPAGEGRDHYEDDEALIGGEIGQLGAKEQAGKQRRKTG